MKTTGRNFSGLFIALATVVLISACSSGGSGGSVAGTGSSSVEGNISSVTVTLRDMNVFEENAWDGFFQAFNPVSTAHASTTIEGVRVDLAGMYTVTDGSGYYRFDGVPPGTHVIRFSGNGYESSMSVTVGVDEMVTMKNVTINGHQAMAGSISHSPMAGGTPGNPGGPGMQ